MKFATTSTLLIVSAMILASFRVGYGVEPGESHAYREGGEQSERDLLLDATRRGEILSLTEVLERVRPQIGGRIVEVEVETENGVLVYELYYLDARGRRREVYVDPRTGTILDHHGD